MFTPPLFQIFSPSLYTNIRTFSMLGKGCSPGSFLPGLQTPLGHSKQSFVQICRFFTDSGFFFSYSVFVAIGFLYTTFKYTLPGVTEVLLFICKKHVSIFNHWKMSDSDRSLRHLGMWWNVINCTLYTKGRADINYSLPPSKGCTYTDFRRKS